MATVKSCFIGCSGQNLLINNDTSTNERAQFDAMRPQSVIHDSSHSKPVASTSKIQIMRSWQSI